MKARYVLTGDEKIPAQITLNGKTTPVWIQSEWTEGEYAEFVQKNGCGHCCVAMVLNLYGKKINPHEEFALWRKMWGEPSEEKEQGNWASAPGIVKVLKSFGVDARFFGVATGECRQTAERIAEYLREGKLVIIWSKPSEKLVPNPFSTGDHYVLLVDIDKNGQILVANSSRKGTTDNGIQFADVDIIEAVLPEGCEPQDCTWGTYHLNRSSGLIVVG